MEKKDKRKKILRVSGLIGLFLIVFGLSYALFTVTLNGTKKVKIKTSKLELQLLDKNNNPIYITDQNNTTSYEINLDEQVPVSDEVGLDSTAFEFKLKNTGNIKASYTIYLDDVALESGEERIDDEYIRYSLTKNGSEESPQGLTSRELDTGSIEADNTTNEYTLKIWIAEDATNEAMDKVFNATLRVEGTQYVAPPTSEYGVEIASTQLTETITATYYQPDGTGYNTNQVKRMSNVKKIDNEETYEGGILVISGTGDMPDDEIFGCSPVQLFLAGVSTSEEFESLWDEENEEYTFKYNPNYVVIEEGVTNIADFSFNYVSSITNIQLPSTIRTLGSSSLDTYSLISVNLPEGLESIDSDALADYKGNSIVIPSTVTLISQYAFENAELSTIYLASTSLQLYNGSFTSLINLQKIYVKTQTIADIVTNSGIPSNKVEVDPTKFE